MIESSLREKSHYLVSSYAGWLNPVAEKNEELQCYKHHTASLCVSMSITPGSLAPQPCVSPSGAGVPVYYGGYFFAGSTYLPKGCEPEGLLSSLWCWVLGK